MQHLNKKKMKKLLKSNYLAAENNLLILTLLL